MKFKVLSLFQITPDVLTLFQNGGGDKKAPYQFFPL